MNTPKNAIYSATAICFSPDELLISIQSSIIMKGNREEKRGCQIGVKYLEE
jgi:hypothetical protein